MKNMGFSHSPFKKLGFWASNVGNNSPAPSYRFHRKFADGFSHLKRQKTDSDIDSAGISGTSKPWAGLMGKGSIILLHTFAPNILEVVWIPIPCHVLWLSICFACDGPGVRNFGEKTSQWQLTTAVYGTIFRGFNSQLGMVTFCLRLFSGLLHYCRRQIKTWTCSCPALKSLRLGVSANLLHWVLKNPIQTPPMDEHTSWQWLGD